MEKLNGSNWWTWKTRMEILLRAEGCRVPIDVVELKPEHMIDDEWKMLDLKAVCCITEWLGDSVPFLLWDKISASTLWKSLVTIYERNGFGDRVEVVLKLMSLKLEDSALVTEHLNEIHKIFFQLHCMKVKLDDKFNALLFLSSIPKSLEERIVSLSDTAPDNMVTIGSIVNFLSTYELSKKSNGQFQSQTLVSENREREESLDSRRGKSGGKAKASKEIKCFGYDELGHIRRNCPLLSVKKEQAEKKREDERIMSINTCNIPK